MRTPRLAVPCVLLAALAAILWPVLSGKRPTSAGADQSPKAAPKFSPASPSVETNASGQVPSTSARLVSLPPLDQDELVSWVARCQSEPMLAAFASWVEQSARGTAPVPEEQGMALAERRNAWLAELILADPERVLELAMPRNLIAALPARAAVHAEEHVAGPGRLALLGVVLEPGQENNFAANWRRVAVNGKEYQAFTYGRRSGKSTRDNILLHGVAWKSKQNPLLAVHESPARLDSK